MSVVCQLVLTGIILQFCRFSQKLIILIIHVTLAPVPLSIFRSNSKFDENSECSSFEYTRLITMIFCTRHDSDTVVNGFSQWVRGLHMLSVIPLAFLMWHVMKEHVNFGLDDNMLFTTKKWKQLAERWILSVWRDGSLFYRFLLHRVGFSVWHRY